LRGRLGHRQSHVGAQLGELIWDFGKRYFPGTPGYKNAFGGQVMPCGEAGRRVAEWACKEEGDLQGLGAEQGWEARCPGRAQERQRPKHRPQGQVGNGKDSGQQPRCPLV
jgi:hypothetical protein